MTLSEMRAMVRLRFEEVGTSSVFLNDDDIDEALNEGLSELSDEVEWYETWRNVSLLAARPYYDLRQLLPVADIAAVLTPGRAYSSQTSRWLIPASARDFDKGNLRWERNRETPQYIHTRGVWFLGYWPITGVESGTIKQYFTALPDDMEVDTDKPLFSKEFHLALVEYAMSILWPQAGEINRAWEAWKAYLTYEKDFKSYVQGRGGVANYQGMSNGPV